VPYEADIPTAALAAAPFPKLVISGDHDSLQDKICDATAEAIDGTREVLGGAGHLIPRAPGCNEMLERVWSS
jgi:hypothetical protein